MALRAPDAFRLRTRLDGPDLARRLLWIFDQQNEAVFVTDGAGRVVELNRAAEELVRAPAAAVLGTGPEHPLWAAITDADGRPVSPDELPAARAARHGGSVTELLRHDGRWLRVESRCADDGSGPLCVTVVVDVTAEIAAREQAADARRHVERIAEVIDRALYTVELEDGGGTRLHYASRGYERLAGAGPWPEIAPQDARKVERALAELRSGARIDLIHRVIAPDGRTRWVRWKAIPWIAPDGRRFVDGVLTDVTADQIAHARLAASEAAQRSAALEHAAIGRLATAIARGDTPGTVFQALAAEVAGVLGVPGAFVAQFDGPEHAILRGLWPPAPSGDDGRGLRFATDGRTVGAEIRRTGRAARVVERDGDVEVLRFGAPIVLGDELWGYIGLGAGPHVELPEDLAPRLEAFAELVATAVASAAARERLVAEATTDPLTGLANSRAFRERLRGEVGRARRHDRPLSVALVDLDHLKHINDAFGHQSGDDVLRRVAAALTGVARESDTVARLGGDEFAMLLPEADAEGAVHLLERVRETLGRGPGAEGRLTISAGVADRSGGEDADALLAAADAALYRAKAAGRDAIRRYHAGAGDDFSPEERAGRLARSQALTALRALARSIDLKDAAARRHSERVAALAADLARALQWPEPRVALLHQAALLHDIGKVAVPDAVLTKPGRLDAGERAEVVRHTAIGAAIAAEALTEEQVAWIRHHHERPDGSGYPDGLAGGEIPDGAALLAIADAWDAMTSERPYRPAKPREAALMECRRLAGTQFSADAVAALERICGLGRA